MRAIWHKIVKLIPTRKQWKNWSLPSKLTAVGAYLGAASILLTVIFYLLPANGKKLTRIELVDVQITSEDKSPAPIIDVKLRNAGDTVIFVKKAILEILDFRELKSCIAAINRPSTYEYDVDLPESPPELPYTKTVSLSQALAPNEVDRFQLRVGTSSIGLERSIHRLRMRFLYNAGKSNTIEAGSLLLMVRRQEVAGAFVVPGIRSEDYLACVRTNREAVMHMLSQSGIRGHQMDQLREELAAVETSHGIQYSKAGNAEAAKAAFDRALTIYDERDLFELGYATRRNWGAGL